ncbi:MAG: chemotaxis protein CheA [Spirochaetaceae bacterium]|nr:MAG: chemotaxis protein CheA [Spirochaetaceae bacterium]
MLDGFQESFRAEAQELLSGLEQTLLELEQNPDNRESIAAVFRAMHTIKGSAGMFGFDDISAFAHHVESILDGVRNGEVSITASLIDLTLQCRDHIQQMLDNPDDPDLPARSRTLQEALEAEARPAPKERSRTFDTPLPTEGIGGDEADGTTPDRVSAESSSSAPGVPATWHIRFVPHADIMANGTNPLLLLEELHEMGDCTVVAHTGGITDLDAIDLHSCSVFWDVFLTTREGKSAISDVFMFVVDQADLTIRLVEEIDFGDEQQYRRLGQILIERGVVEPAVVEEALAGQKRLGQVLRERGVDQDEIDAALREQEHARRTREKVQSEAGSASIRVQSEKLDDLVDLVGELVTLQARLNQTAHLSGDAGVGVIAENFERLIGELRDHTMSIRMLPISSSFSRFRRLVRDLARDLGKEVDLITEGGDTELDKTVIERLHDPLVHVIRNSVDHGLEPPQDRIAAGKSSNGTIALRARHVGANVEIRVEDDGRGLNREKILLRAAERGLVSPEAQLEDRELYDLVFMAGFSTAEAVTSVSGRGVGMDVVRRELDSIGGSVSIESRSGEGSALVMTIPLTLAIIDGLLVRIGEERFVFPLSNVEECIEYLRTPENRGTVVNRGTMMPVIDLRSEFSIQGEYPEIEQAVVVRTGNGCIGFIVDAVIGEHQTVIKNLGKLYNNVEAVSGATILGDGTVALIIDVQRLMGRITDAKRHIK